MAITRRDFLKGTIAGAITAASWSRVLAANETLRVGVVGFRGRGKSHIDGFGKLKGAKIVALCDVDSDVLGKTAKGMEGVETYADVRKMLENKNIDVVSIATPNHTHALITVWSCQAGKDVYVEKPISHNIFEGRKMIEAARKYNRIVQCGTQSRSNTGMREAVAYIQSGALGKIKLVRGLCYKTRDSIGKVSGEQPIPKNIDYDLWTGPAPLVPLRRANLHYDWHWVWDTGNGDLGNQGVHQVDISRWILQADQLPPRAMSVGGRFGYEDDGQTPNTQIALFEYEPAPFIFEVRGLAKVVEAKDGGKKEKVMDAFDGARVGVITYCENGKVVMPSYAGGIVYDNDGKKTKEFKGEGNHFENCMKAIASRKPADLNADVAEGHLSAALCHVANISHRIGKAAPAGAIAEAVKGRAEAQATFERFQEHLKGQGVDLAATPPTLGAWLKIDAKTERFVDNEAANAQLTRAYRAPFVVPEKV